MGDNRPLAHLLIVTGGSSGIGRSLAEVALADGATVANIGRSSGPGQYFVADLANPDTWQPSIDWIAEQVKRDSWNRISMVQCAATLTPIGFAGEVDLAEYTANVLLNAASAQVLGSGFIEVAEPLGVAANLIMMSSGAGKRPIPGWSSYCAAKAGVDMWVRDVGLERTQRSSAITVTSVSPGVVATKMQAEIRESGTNAFPDVEMFRDLHATGALADPDSVAAAYWALCQRDDLPQGGVFNIDER